MWRSALLFPASLLAARAIASAPDFEVLFDIDSIELAADQHTETRRGIYIDDYGRPRVAISFSKDGGRPAQLDISFPWEREKTAFASRLRWSAAVPDSIWKQVIALPLPPVKPTQEDFTSGDICIHGRTGLVEAASPSIRAWLPFSVAANACSDARPVQYVRALGSLARQVVPNCTDFDESDYRPDGLLYRCLVTAEVGKRAAGFMKALDEEADAWLHLIGPNTRTVIGDRPAISGAIDPRTAFGLAAGDKAKGTGEEELYGPLVRHFASSPDGRYVADVAFTTHQALEDGHRRVRRTSGTIAFEANADRIEIVEIRLREVR